MGCAISFYPVLSGGHNKFLPILRGGRGAKSFGPAISRFCIPPLQVVNDQSVRPLNRSVVYQP